MCQLWNFIDTFTPKDVSFFSDVNLSWRTTCPIDMSALFVFVNGNVDAKWRQDKLSTSQLFYANTHTHLCQWLVCGSTSLMPTYDNLYFWGRRESFKTFHLHFIQRSSLANIRQLVISSTDRNMQLALELHLTTTHTYRSQVTQARSCYRVVTLTTMYNISRNIYQLLVLVTNVRYLTEECS